MSVNSDFAMAADVPPSKPTMEEREIGQMAVWSLSTAKPGNGVEQLRDDNIETYWQCVCKPTDKISLVADQSCVYAAGPMGPSHI